MFASTITLANVAAANHDFDLVKTLGNETTRIDLATTLANPTTMMIRHLAIKKGGIAYDKHTVSFKKVGTDPTSNAKSDTICTVSFEVPQVGVIVIADTQDLWAYVRNFLPSAAPATNFLGLALGKS